MSRLQQPGPTVRRSRRPNTRWPLRRWLQGFQSLCCELCWLLLHLEEAFDEKKSFEEWTRSIKNAFVSGSVLIFAPSEKLNSSLNFHRISPQNDLNETLFILLWENLRICNCLKAKFWENCYSKSLIFIRDVFFCFGHPLKNWIARSFFIGFCPKMTQMKIYLYYFEKI